MTRPWLAHYAPGVPSSVDVDRYPSLTEMIHEACAEYAGRTAFCEGGAAISYARLDELARDFAAWLQQGCGLLPGDRLALMLPNSLAYVVALVGAWRAGLVVVNVNPQYTARELLHQLTDSGAQAIVAFDGALAVVREVRANTRVQRVLVASRGDPEESYVTSALEDELEFAQALAIGRMLPLEPPPTGPEDLALLQYTGGTTGVAKGAMLTHRNLIANLAQGEAWYGQALEHGREVAVTALPLYHIFGLTFNGLLMLRFGVENRLVANPRDTGELQAAFRPGFTILSGVNTLYSGLLNAPWIDEVDFGALKLSVSGGSATQGVISERWQALTGCRIVEGYGLTETSPFVMSNPLHLGREGGLLPMPSTEVSIRDDDGQGLAPGSIGEICVRGPQVMRGYWRQQTETAAAFASEGWLRTGDLGVMDQRGVFAVTDRKKDMVLVSGFNVFPNEVEDVLVGHPLVLEAAVVGVSDPRTGEALKAFVIARGPGLSEETLIAHCRAQLAAYKVPRLYQFVDHLPKSQVGKILRRTLRT